jgi:ribosomal protein S6E (S10)
VQAIFGGRATSGFIAEATVGHGFDRRIRFGLACWRPTFAGEVRRRGMRGQAWFWPDNVRRP